MHLEISFAMQNWITEVTRDSAVWVGGGVRGVVEAEVIAQTKQQITYKWPTKHMAIVGCKSHQMMATMPKGGGGRAGKRRAPTPLRQSL